MRTASWCLTAKRRSSPGWWGRSNRLSVLGCRFFGVGYREPTAENRSRGSYPIHHQRHSSRLPSLSQRRFIRAEDRRAGRDRRFQLQVPDEQHQGLSRREVRVQIVALGFEDALQSLQRAALRRRLTCEGLLELGGDLAEHGVKEAALGVVVVEQQLLIDPGPARDGVHARAIEPTAGELLAGG